MTKLGEKFHYAHIIDVLRQKNVTKNAARRLSISRRSEGERAETLALRSLAEQSLVLPQGQHS